MNEPIADLNSAVRVEGEKSAHHFEARTIYVKGFIPYYEVLAEAIAEFLSVKVVPVKIGEKDVIPGVPVRVFYSEKFYTDEEKFIRGDELLSEYRNFKDSRLDLNRLNNLTDIKAALEYKFGDANAEAISEVMADLIKVFCFDIIMQNYDRHNENWGVIVSSGRPRLAPLYDNGRILNGDYFALGLEYGDQRDLTMLGAFIDTATTADVTMFYDMYKALTPEAFATIVRNLIAANRVEIGEEVSEGLVRAYSKVRARIQVVLNEKGEEVLANGKEVYNRRNAK